MNKITLKHDREITIATGESRKSTKWINSRMRWSELLARLQVPLRTAESISEYQQLPKKKRDEIKDVGGFVGGTLKGGRRLAENIAARDVLTLDLDSIPTGVEIWPMFEDVFNTAVCMYSTHSHTENSNRLRLVFPLARTITPDEYGAVSRMIAQDVGIDYCDDTTYEPHRLMYWPSASRDAEYIFRYMDGPLLDPDEILARYIDWTDTSQWPTSSRRQDAITKRAKKQGDPLTKPGIVGAFCKTYDIPAAIAAFLPETYADAGHGRYTYAKGSTEAGLVLYENGNFAYSHHGTDPCSGLLVNSFDMVRLHKFGELDEDLDEDVAITKRPSYEKMVDFALQDEAVAYQLTLDKVEMFDEEEDQGTEWLKLLELTKKGDIAATITNIEIILKNDPRLAGLYYYDQFRRKPYVCGDLPWVKRKARNTDEWTDTDDAGLRAFLEKEYKISAAGKVSDAVELAMLANSRHPVREYLNGLSWDGTERMETLFIKYLGAEDCPYTRAVTRAALIGAVARILQPGCKHDHMLVLVGEQGRRKSTTLIKLGRDWYTDSLHTIKGKEAFENIQGYWIIEMGEMAAARRAEIEALKQFLSKRSDNYRAAYARRTEDHPRQCAFFGSTNDVEFLRDLTGSRRFWPVTVDDTGIYMVDKLTDDIVDQIWAEAVVAYEAGEKWYLSPEMEAAAAEVQKQHTPESEMAGSIREFLEREIPIDFLDRSIEERRAYWENWDEDPGDSADLLAPTKPRDRVCAAEIWCELFGEKIERLDRKTSFEINQIIRATGGWTPTDGSSRFGKGYGSRRGFYRKIDDLI